MVKSDNSRQTGLSRGRKEAESAMHKLKEFADLGYPAQERVRACRVLARERDWQVWMMAATLQKHM